MKKTIFVMALAIVSLSMSAQKITYNAKGGLGLAKVAGSDADTDWTFVSKIGAGIEKPFARNWSVMPSLEVAVKGFKSKSRGEKEQSHEFNLFYVQIPVVAAYRFNVSDTWNITPKVGPYFAYGVAGSDKAFEDGDDGGGLKRFDMGIDVGLDFERHRFVFGLEFERGFTSLADGYKAYTQAFYATVGWKF